MVVIPSRETVEHYQEMKKEIEATVGRINGKYDSLAWQPVVYQYRSLSFAEMVALYDRSDVGLITPIRDGMNLVAKEYLACQCTNPGVLILSEMAGAAAELSEAILINPTDKAEMAAAIAKALDMPLPDRQAGARADAEPPANLRRVRLGEGFLRYDGRCQERAAGAEGQTDQPIDCEPNPAKIP